MALLNVLIKPFTIKLPFSLSILDLILNTSLKLLNILYTSIYIVLTQGLKRRPLKPNLIKSPILDIFVYLVL
jgi:hypothetical protein